MDRRRRTALKMAAYRFWHGACLEGGQAAYWVKDKDSIMDVQTLDVQNRWQAVRDVRANRDSSVQFERGDGGIAGALSLTNGQGETRSLSMSIERSENGVTRSASHTTLSGETRSATSEITHGEDDHQRSRSVTLLDGRTHYLLVSLERTEDGVVRSAERTGFDGVSTTASHEIHRDGDGSFYYSRIRTEPEGTSTIERTGFRGADGIEIDTTRAWLPSSSEEDGKSSEDMGDPIIEVVDLTV
jgi:hypothetical protein